MSDDSLLWNAPRPPPRKPRKGEPLFAMTKEGHRINCELHGHGEYGWEARFLRNGELFTGRRFDTRTQAVQWAELERNAMMRDDWS